MANMAKAVAKALRKKGPGKARREAEKCMVARAESKTRIQPQRISPNDGFEEATARFYGPELGAGVSLAAKSGVAGAVS
jgi:hypothetical protein